VSRVILLVFTPCILRPARRNSTEFAQRTRSEAWKAGHVAPSPATQWPGMAV